MVLQPTRKPIVTLPVFEGPLDLLLQLIEERRLDITAIAVAEVADQYLTTVRGFTDRSPADLAEFLVIGARLLVIKTRALLPRSPVEDLRLTEEDAGEQLARQLQEYSRFKRLAALLKERDAAGLRTYVRAAAPPLPPRPTTPEDERKLDVTLDQLVAVVEKRLKLLKAVDDPPIALPKPKVLTIDEVAAELQRRLQTYAWVTFDDLLSLAATRAELIVTLWTVLELFKRHIITIEQDGLFEAISIGRGDAFGAGVMSLEG
jgi:segregation and condensation protein A